ncbi:MAG: hypothetical protein BWY62_00019 [Firmicutes bacterium ADurb.Bin356]|nr:MAG: hypothetical protein BWY62_00019 [Firmicutes bacterium ADurb.Bin356]
MLLEPAFYNGAMSKNPDSMLDQYRRIKAKLRDEIRSLQGEIQKAPERPAPGTIGSRKPARGRTRK